MVSGGCHSGRNQYDSNHKNLMNVPQLYGYLCKGYTLGYDAAMLQIMKKNK